MQEQIDNYFRTCDEKGDPYLITGLALALDTTRETLLDYEDKEDYSDTIKKAKLKCQSYTEKHLYSGKNATGAIFSLKNNYGWKDKTEQEIDLTSQGESMAPVAEETRQKFQEFMKQDTKS